MTIVEQIARYIDGHGLPCVCQFLPQAPDAISAVMASDLRLPSDTDGARVQVITRSARGDTVQGLAAAQDIAELLDGFGGILTVDGCWVTRILLESGPASIGADDNGRLEYSTNFRVWYCD